MVTTEDLRSFTVLKDLRDDMLAKIAPLVDVLTFESGDLIFHEGDRADRFYMLKRGKFLLEQRITPTVTISLGSIKPNYSFGWSAMLEDGSYTVDTICSEPSEVYSVRSEKFRKLLSNDHSLGYMLTRQLLRMIKNRLDRRTEQLLKLIRNHPDMQSLF